MFFCAASRDSSIAYFGGSRRRVQWETALVVIFNSAARADGPPRLCTKLLTLTKTFILNYTSFKLHFVIKNNKPQKQKRKVYTPACTWAANLGYDGIVWAAYNRVTLFVPMGFSWATSSSYSGGCYRKSSDWEDPPRGPCANDYRKKVTMGVFNWTWIFSSHLQKLRKNPKILNCSTWTLSRKYRLKINGKWVQLNPT